NAYYPGLDDQELRLFSTESVVTTAPTYYELAAYFWKEFTIPSSGPNPEFFGKPAIVFEHEDADCAACPLRFGPVQANFGFSTIVSHEYGHYLLDDAFGIEFIGNRAIHEGYADILSLFHHDPLD